ncbi:hypothetical protein D3C86_1556860 [compost metagenome]
MSDLQRAVGLFVGRLSQFFGFSARVRHRFIGLLTGGEHGIKGIHRGPWQTRLDVNASDFDPKPLPGCRQLCQALIDPLHQITSQTLPSFGSLVVSADQLRTGHQNGVQIASSGQRDGAAGHQSMHCSTKA